MHLGVRTGGAATEFRPGDARRPHAGEGFDMYGLIGKILTMPGARDELASVLLEGIGGMPGCLSYVVAHDTIDADALWVTEVWTDGEAHRASLSLPSVQGAIAQARPLIAGFGERIETQPVGGHALGSPG